MATEVRTRQWGNSIGVIIPKEVVENLKIKQDEEILIEVEKKGSPLKDLFGALKFSKQTGQLIKEARKELESKWV